MTTWRLMDGLSGRPGNGPAVATAFTGSYIAGAAIRVTGKSYWLDEYLWWVPATNGVTAPQKFCLWQATGPAAGTLVPNSTVTSGTLTAGAWNPVSLTTPLLLPQGVGYVPATGLTAVSPQGFPSTQAQFGASPDPYSAGITNGPLTAYSDPAGTAPLHTNWLPQMPFTTAGSDPTLHFPSTGDVADNLWIDVLIGDVAPAGATSRLWPNMPSTLQSVSSDVTGYTLGTQFSLSQAGKLTKIWHYSPPTCAALPTRCGLWDITSQTEVAGSDNSAPTWLLPGGGTATAGAGWVYVDYSTANVVIPASTPTVTSTFHANGATWMAVTNNYWTTGVGGSGLISGIMSAPNEAGSAHGQGCYHLNAWAFPGSDIGTGENYWVDAEFLPVASGSGLMMASGIL